MSTLNVDGFPKTRPTFYSGWKCGKLRVLGLKQQKGLNETKYTSKEDRSATFGEKKGFLAKS